MEIKDRIDKIETVIYGLQEAALNPFPKNQSLLLDKLYGALAKAQGEFGPIEKNRKSHRGKYADLDGILKEVRPILSKHGLTLSQYRIEENGADMLHTRIGHESGQWIAGHFRLKPEDPTNDQSIGKNMSYQKRYEVQSILGIASSDDPTDDDGWNRASPNKPFKITQPQVEVIKEAIGDHSTLESVIKKHFKIQTFSDILVRDYDTVMNAIKKAKGQ